MAKFIFKMQSLLNIKLQMEDSLKNEMGKAVQRLELEKQILSDMENERIELISQFNDQSQKNISVNKLREYSAYISHLKDKMEDQKENINKVQKIVDKYREELIKIMQERQMLEKLREKKYTEFLREQFDKEQKLIDEVTSYKYSSRTTGEEDG